MIKVGKPDVSPGALAHIKGVSQGNEPGKPQDGHKPDGRATSARSTGVYAAHAGPIDASMPNLPPA
jgi:hypothetical protein